MRPRWLIELEGPRPPIEPRAAQLLGALAVAVSDRLVDAMASSVGLSPSAVAALQWIERAPGVHARELSKALGIGQPAVAHLVATLVAQELVLRERDRADRRADRLRVSELGAQRAQQAARARAHLTQSLVECLPTVLRPRLVRIAERILSILLEPPVALQACRYCDWQLCRFDSTAPCPVVLAGASRGSSSRGQALDPPLLHEDRRTIVGRDPPIELWLEPGGIAFKLDARRRLEVVCRGTARGRMQPERLEEGHVALHAWSGAIFTVLEAGREIFVQDRAMSLDMAEGKTPRERVVWLYGDFARRRGTPPARWL